SRIRERQGDQPWPGSLTNRERSHLTSEHRVVARTIYRDEAKGSRIRERQGDQPWPGSLTNRERSHLT
ncbi:hypothetical protein AB4084_42345, partial [Lysobacter sp. 2RAB21]